MIYRSRSPQGAEPSPAKSTQLGARVNPSTQDRGVIRRNTCETVADHPPPMPVAGHEKIDVLFEPVRQAPDEAEAAPPPAG